MLSLVHNKVSLAVISALLLVGCSSSPDETSESSGVNDVSVAVEQYESQAWDPFESFNRAMWTVNYEYLDPYFVRPVSLAYVNYMPIPIRSGIANTLSNLDEPSSMVNSAIMGNGEDAITHFNRFWINTIFGLFGIFDVAGAGGVGKIEERAFSDALGHYGVGNGPYVVAPGYGPVTVRETTDLVDGLYLPLSYLNIWGALGKWALEGLESRAELVSQEQMLEDSPDSYAFTREIYIQRRDYKAQVNQEEVVDEEEEALLDEYLDEEF